MTEPLVTRVSFPQLARANANPLVPVQHVLVPYYNSYTTLWATSQGNQKEQRTLYDRRGDADRADTLLSWQVALQSQGTAQLSMRETSLPHTQASSPHPRHRGPTSPGRATRSPRSHDKLVSPKETLPDSSTVFEPTDLSRQCVVVLPVIACPGEHRKMPEFVLASTASRAEVCYVCLYHVATRSIVSRSVGSGAGSCTMLPINGLVRGGVSPFPPFQRRSPEGLPAFGMQVVRFPSHAVWSVEACATAFDASAGKSGARGSRSEETKTGGLTESEYTVEFSFVSAYLDRQRLAFSPRRGFVVIPDVAPATTRSGVGSGGSGGRRRKDLDARHLQSRYVTLPKGVGDSKVLNTETLPFHTSSAGHTRGVNDAGTVVWFRMKSRVPVHAFDLLRAFGGSSAKLSSSPLITQNCADTITTLLSHHPRARQTQVSRVRAKQLEGLRGWVSQMGAYEALRMTACSPARNLVRALDDRGALSLSARGQWNCGTATLQSQQAGATHSVGELLDGYKGINEIQLEVLGPAFWVHPDYFRPELLEKEKAVEENKEQKSKDVGDSDITPKKSFIADEKCMYMCLPVAVLSRAMNVRLSVMPDRLSVTNRMPSNRDEDPARFLLVARSPHWDPNRLHTDEQDWEEIMRFVQAQNTANARSSQKRHRESGSDSSENVYMCPLEMAAHASRGSDVFQSYAYLYHSQTGRYVAVNVDRPGGRIVFASDMCSSAVWKLSLV